MTADQLSIVFAARDNALASTEAVDGWDKALVQQAILARIETLGTASANDVRELISVRRRSLIGAVFNSLRMRGVIEIVGEVTSTDVGTHGKSIKAYRLATP